MKQSIVFFFSFLLVSSASAQEQASGAKRGLITSGPCPLRCEDLKVPRKFCKETRYGTTCQVEDLSQPAGHRSMARVPLKNYKEWSSKTEKNMKMKRRGLVTTAPCPYTCKDAGVPQKFCRESKAGNQCQVEDLSQVPGHRSMIPVKTSDYKEWNTDTRAQLKMERRGLITSSSCPYTCKLARVPAKLCRDWRAGATCYVEDFTQPPGHRTRISLPKGY